MNYQLIINRLRLHGFHGVMPQEKVVGANFYVTLEANFCCDPSAYEQDDLDGTLNYAEVVELLKKEMLVSSNLLEHVAHRMAKKLLAKYPRICDINLLIEKENPPIGHYCEGLGVKISMKR